MLYVYIVLSHNGHKTSVKELMVETCQFTTKERQSHIVRKQNQSNNFGHETLAL